MNHLSASTTTLMYYLQVFINSSTSAVLFFSRSYCFSSITFLLISLLPIPTAQTPALNQPLMFSLLRSTPPVGIKSCPGKRLLIEDRNSVPRILAWKTLIRQATCYWARGLSLGVKTPG